MATSAQHQEPWYLRSSVPVLFPTHDGFDLSISQSEFDALVQGIVSARDTAEKDEVEDVNDEKSDEADSFTLVSEVASEEVQGALAQLDLTTAADTRSEESRSPFIQGLLSHDTSAVVPPGDMENRMLTENADVAYRSTTSPIVDLFTELEDVVSGPRLRELLNAAWEEDSLATLKIIFNARSIHLGKASQVIFYRCAGWLVRYHPLTLLGNLRWLGRPIIQKKMEKKEKTEETDSEMVVVDAKPQKDDDVNVDDMTRFDVRNGVSHGYWKDLLNILVLGVEGKLDVLIEPYGILYVEQEQRMRHVAVSKEEAKVERRNTRDKRHDAAITAFDSNPVYRGLHLTVARLFAEQLKIDLALLRSEDPKAKKNISLCAKWAPSHDRFHDKHTFIVSSLAEMLHPAAEVAAGQDGMDREVYLRRAREAYRRDVSALRAHLDIVERKLTTKTYEKIEYSHVPSLAMHNYADIFAKRDPRRFGKYLDDVTEGRAQISGAILLPSTLIKPFREMVYGRSRRALPRRKIPAPAADKLQDSTYKVLNGQWKTLVQRIKDSGTLESSIAVCDVSGSMGGPVFRDGTCPMDSSVGLSLLLAEVTAPPFGGHFISFSQNPSMNSIDLSEPLSEKVRKIVRFSDWGMNTNFTAVFEQLILPMAIRHKLSQDEMVKRVFVFSDMQFDEAECPDDTFSSSFERIKKSYADAGYEMPELIFWNLAGGRAGYDQERHGGDSTAPKPVQAEETGTAIVSGYSQAMLKMFLDNGSFEDADAGEDAEEDVKTTEDDDAVVVDSVTPAKKRRLDPMSTVKKAISHKGYDPLVVMD
ncbi:hypothetical protein F5X97DRAFT_18169 [Nemania serpens]|nr:hypothetical protein F5X97DRAFT_18169 [Nemania serpens]